MARRILNRKDLRADFDAAERRKQDDEESDETVLRVQDDGPGFDLGAVLSRYSQSGSLGLLQMREGARMIGGRLILDSSPGHGTRIVLRIPLESVPEPT